MNPVTGIQELTGFQDHFYYVFVAVIFGAFAGIPVEEEDIHLGLDESIELRILINPFCSIITLLVPELELELELVQVEVPVKERGQEREPRFP